MALPVSSEYLSSRASVTFPTKLFDVRSDNVVMPFINTDCSRLLFSDFEMAQMSLSWHRLGDIKADRELEIVSSDIDPLTPP